MYCSDTSQMMFNICANKEKYSVIWQSLKWEKLVCFLLFCNVQCSAQPTDFTPFCENSCEVQELLGTYDFVLHLCKSEGIYF